MSDTLPPASKAGTAAPDATQKAAQTGWQVTNSDAVVIRQMINEQQAHYQETGKLPASADIPLGEVTDVASHQPDGDAMPFTGFRKKSG